MVMNEYTKYVLDQILSRHSYRGKYKADSVPREHLKAIMEAGLAAPSGCNKQTTRLIAVDEPKLLATLKAAIDPPVAATAPAMICVLTQRINAYRDRCFATQDYSAAIENMLVAITALGYQSCWYEGHITDTDRIGDKLARILGVPEEYELVCILPVGIAEDEVRKPKKLPFEDRAWFNCFQGNRKMDRTIKTMEEKYLLSSLDLVESVFSEWACPEEGKMVRSLVEEIRSKKYYLPELELVMVDDADQIIGYCMFSRFHIEGRYEDELLIMTPVAVKTNHQRQHISRDLIEYGCEKAKSMGFKAILVEGDPRNYHPRGFVTSADCGIVAGPNIHLPHVSCLMIKELVPGALEHIHGIVDYSFYEALHAE